MPIQLQLQAQLMEKQRQLQLTMYRQQHELHSINEQLIFIAQNVASPAVTAPAVATPAVTAQPEQQLHNFGQAAWLLESNYVRVIWLFMLVRL